MRPVRLEVEGFTSFREHTELDFTGLDLFAITGATGAGKSSLIDAIVFALYGQVPRVGRSYKQLISHGAERLSVRLDFEVGGQTYRIVRAVRARGQSAVRLERIANGSAEPVADRVRDIEAAVERIVGLDYDAFTRSVVLPQGQFDAFLKGEPEERRKILVALLNLGVYGDMQGIVNRRAVEARTRSELVGRQLETDFGEADEANLARCRSQLEAARGEAAGLEKELAGLAGSIAAAGKVRSIRAEAQRLKGTLEEERGRRKRAQQTLAEAAARRRNLEARLAEVAKSLEAVHFDPERQLRLVEARPRLERLLAARRRVQDLEIELERSRVASEKADASAASAAKAAQVALLKEEAERSALEGARRVRDAARVRHAAHALRRELRPGEPCPVCESTVASVPGSGAPGLDAPEAALAAAETSSEAAREERFRCDREVTKAEGERESRRRDRARLADTIDEARREVGTLEESLAGALGDLGDPETLAAKLAAELETLDSARRERERLETTRAALEREQAALAAELSGAERSVADAGERIGQLEQAHDAAWRELENVRKGLLTRLRRAGWEDPALDRPLEERDELHALEDRRTRLERARSEVSARAARLEESVTRLERDVARAVELRDQKRALDADAALYGTLAQHLHADQFVAYVQIEALRLLAEDGSRHLRGLSQGRYSLESESQDFLVVDHWNADQRRSVRTLSGGESFLASLALALALAERLAELSVEGRAGETLESLFLDEGFGTLDPEALDLVVQAIEALQGGRRLVGVITHIQSLAERLPARVEVARASAGAQLSLA